MIVPFKAAGIDVKFYRVEWDGRLKIALDGSADILLWCNYFGFKNEMPEFDGVVIEDVTHSFLSESPCHLQSDYLVASLRKWEPVNCGGYCSVEIDGKIPPDEFITLKSAAMELKTEYLEEPQAEKKERFLQMFGRSNHWLAENYSGLLVDPFSREYLERVDVEKKRKIRRDNAWVLYGGYGLPTFRTHTPSKPRQSTSALNKERNLLSCSLAETRGMRIEYLRS